MDESPIFSLILDELGRTLHYKMDFQKLCKKIKRKAKPEHIEPFQCVEDAVEFAVQKGQKLGIFLRIKETIPLRPPSSNNHGMEACCAQDFSQEPVAIILESSLELPKARGPKAQTKGVPVGQYKPYKPLPAARRVANRGKKTTAPKPPKKRGGGATKRGNGPKRAL